MRLSRLLSSAGANATPAIGLQVWDCKSRPPGLPVRPYSASCTLGDRWGRPSAMVYTADVASALYVPRLQRVLPSSLHTGD